MTCPSLLRRGSATEALGEPSPETAPEDDSSASWVVTRLRADDTLAQFARFVLVGAATTVVYAIFFVSLHGSGYLPAHLVATAISTVLANELHRRLTFRAGERVSWFAAQWEGGALALAGMVATSLALSWFNSSVHEPAVVAEVLVIAAVTATIGVLRFLALRWVFRPHPA